ncbi:Uncharacterized protein BP5553_04229 [Venustampulla echinocandica]|uniref:R3H-associated N-terminal domain-containing protein n=1 Tax=Venustampulla echinocandica TaxID=2656787 RepID=A0A370TWJ3_9HELO|nr:Uncharacterized protein BP5553_04229 [Venustampulla echinocandica]RDL39889.1 Uncharacterized protein BP5553_04229 [Venustampulla echinocandica]
MAIYSSVPPPEQQAPLSNAQSTTATIDTLNALSSLSISPSARSTGVTLSIPLDGAEVKKRNVKPAKEPLRRDSLKRRDALLKGKEGTRRRQRWENDRFLNVPNAQPPLPSDWEVRPTYPVHTVPYYLAPLWDLRAETTSSRKSKSSSGDEQKGRVPQELKAKLKRSKGAKSLLQELEEEVRKFVREYERQEHLTLHGGMEDEPEIDSEDEEIVFIGRNGRMSDEVRQERERVEEVLEKEKMIWEGAADDRGAGFGRWLVHSIATYYGLSSRSITLGNPARREAYVGIKSKEIKMKTGRRITSSSLQGEMPRPLYGLI